MRLIFVCLLDDLILRFCYSNFDAGNPWIRIRIYYHPCITSEPKGEPKYIQSKCSNARKTSPKKIIL